MTLREDAIEIIHKRVRPFVTKMVTSLYNEHHVSYFNSDGPYDNVVFRHSGREYKIYKDLFFRVTGKSTLVIDDKTFYEAMEYMIKYHFDLV